MQVMRRKNRTRAVLVCLDGTACNGAASHARVRAVDGWQRANLRAARSAVTCWRLAAG